MNETGTGRPRWTLTPEAFRVLLDHLGSDPDAAAEQFRILHNKLALFFRANRCSFAERWADESLDRMAKRVSEGQPITDVNAFARGVARLVLLEARKQERREHEAWQAGSPRSAASENGAVLDALDDCMGCLPTENRDLIVRYYAPRPEREKLAHELGITVEALRTRALRIRRELEACVSEKRKAVMKSGFRP